MHMNPTARAVLPGVAGLLLATFFTATAFTNQPPVLKTLPLFDGSTNLVLKPLNPGPLIYLNRNPGSSQPLAPGVYQTRPYAMIVVVPKPGLDDRCVAGATGAGSKMPVAKPELQAVPLLPAK